MCAGGILISTKPLGLCSAIHFCAVQLCEVQFSSVKCSSVQSIMCIGVLCGIVMCSAGMCIAFMCSAVLCSAVMCSEHKTLAKESPREKKQPFVEHVQRYREGGQGGLDYVQS